MTKRKQQKMFIVFVSAILLVLCLICLLQVSTRTTAERQSKVTLNRFEGTFSYDGVHWQAITEKNMPSARHRTVTLRGHFTEDIPEGYRLYYYRDHIGVSFYQNGRQILSDWDLTLGEDDNRLDPEICGREWLFVISPGFYAQEELEIRMTNPHRYSNESSFREFLDTTYVSDGSSNGLENMLHTYSFFPEIIGILLCVISAMLLGIAAASWLRHIPMEFPLINYAMASLFCGIFLLTDIIDISFWSEHVARNTYTRQLSMMLAAYFAELTLCDVLSGNRRRLALFAINCTAILDGLFVLYTILGKMVIYDTQPFWSGMQLLLCPMLLACGINELMHSGKNRRTGIILAISLPTAILLDISNVWDSIYSSVVFTRVAASLVFLYFAIRAIHYVLISHNATARAKQLEKELAESRISIMLSQLQPHFLYNVLNSIYYLCKHDPMAARDMVDKFSDYLRNNMASLEKQGLIPFAEEFRHVQTYLSLELIRFQKTLRVDYDIETEDFCLPPLTIQPLVENAVRHGINKKQGGGLVTISTMELADRFLITVRDTGCGFDPVHYAEDGKLHIGIRNVRERLERMVGGTLSIESVPDVGTAATIMIPKKEGLSE